MPFRIVLTPSGGAYFLPSESRLSKTPEISALATTRNVYSVRCDGRLGMFPGTMEKESSGSTKTSSAGIALCLSGGGFRATLFHLGAVGRLNELGVLSRLTVITSVSGGSILNGFLAARWSELVRGADGVFSNFNDVIAAPLRRFCGRDLRTPLLFGTRLSPEKWPELMRSFGAVPANALADAYQSLYRRAGLQELAAPAPGTTPRFVFCATNVATGACWHFHGGPGSRMGDFYTGYTDTHSVSVAEAVAASSAFPPGFAALRLSVAGKDFSRVDPWGKERAASKKRKQVEPRRVSMTLLTDGGVYDNLGVEPVWNGFRCLLVSDAGQPFVSHENCRQTVVSRLKRAAEISMEQVGAVRKRWLVASFKSGERKGGLWAINTPLEDYELQDAQGYSAEGRELFAKIRTDLNAFSEGEIGCLENHGYSLADAAMRSRAAALCPTPSAPFRWPDGNWCGDSDARRALEMSGKRSVLRDVWRHLMRPG